MVLFFLIFFLLTLTSIILILNINIKLSIDNLTIDTEKKKLNYEFEVGLYIFNKIRVVGLKINKKKIEKIRREINGFKKSKIIKLISKINFEKITLKLEDKLKHQITNNINIFKAIKIIIKNLKLQTLEYNMNLEIGINDVCYNSFLITVISTVIAIALKLTAKSLKKCFYKIIPIYGNGNILKLNLNCIINLKVVHIINTIYLISKKGKSDKYVRTSNRRSYDYCHE